MLSAGMFLAYLLGYVLDSWRTICWVLLFQPILSILTFTFIKESPYWLVQNGRKEEALTSLQWYRGENCDVSAELSEIVKKKEESTQIEGFREKLSLVFSIPFLKALSTSGALFFLVQFTGISALVMFMVNIFQDTNSSIDPRLAPVIVGAIRIVFATFCSFALKKGNRKVMLCGSVFILSLCTLGLALLDMYRVEGEDQHPILGYLPIVFIFIMFMAHAFGVNGVIHVLTAEVFPTSIRSFGSGLSLCMGSIGSALQSYLFALMSRCSQHLSAHLVLGYLCA